MCGLIGHFSFGGKELELNAVKSGVNTLHSRGPDDSGLFLDDNVVLGHARLSVIDIEHNAQPLTDNSSRYTIVYNGEIYNYKELISLIDDSCGHYLNDTSVILLLYKKYGESFVSMLNGMFAFAIWDSYEQSLFIARDRFGEKPFYFSINNNGFFFASTIPALLNFEGIDHRISQKAVSEFLAYQFVNSGSIYASIEKLAPGYCAKINKDQTFSQCSYWSINNIDCQSSLKAKDYEEKVNYLLSDSVQMRLNSDVPVGVFLSGGVDSSIITSLAAEYLPRIQTISVGFDSPSYDESSLASLASAKYNTNHSQIVIPRTPDRLFDLLSDIAKSVGEPFADSAMVPTWQMCQQASQLFTVALSGDGADEAFGGYRRYYAAKFGRMLADYIPGFSKVLSVVANNINDTDTYFGSSRSKQLILLSRFLGQSSISSLDKIPRVMTNSELTMMGRKPIASNMSSVCLEEYSEVQKYQVSDFENYLPNDILIKTDRSSMQFGLEVRTPFLDYRLIELAFSMPDYLKLDLFNQKNILKKVFKNKVHPEILKRKKHGFASPVSSWLQGPLRGVMNEAIISNELSDYIDVAYLKKLWMEHLKSNVDHSYKLWTILNLYIWLISRGK